MTTWRNNPATWSATVLIGIFLVSTLPTAVFVFASLHTMAILWAIGALTLWHFLGIRTGSGFPLLFDMLALGVILISGGVLLYIAISWLGPKLS